MDQCSRNTSESPNICEFADISTPPKGFTCDDYFSNDLVYISIFEDHWQQQLQPRINVLPSGRPHNPSWPTIFLLMFITHSSVNPPHRRLLSGVSCPGPLKFPFQITQVTVFNDSLHDRSHEDHFPLLSWLHRGSGSEGARSEASRSEESAPWSICRRRLGSLRAPNFECSRADQSWQVGSFWGLSGERFTLPACTELDNEVYCPAVFTNRG